jgi:hypothetical protein
MCGDGRASAKTASSLAKVELTESWRHAVPHQIRARYDFLETRNASAVLASTNREPFDDLCTVVADFTLTTSDILVAGGNETGIASRLNDGFRSRGWHEERAVTVVRNYMQERGSTREADDGVIRAETTAENKGYFIDNVKGRVVLDVEWNAKDGNLDRDLAMYRWLYEVGFVDVAVMVTREHFELRDHGVYLRRENGQDEKTATAWLKTTTTTNTFKLVDRLRAGNAGGCPFLAVAITKRAWEPGVSPRKLS